jgi:hypothetical protein
MMEDLRLRAIQLRVKVYAENGNLMEAGTWAPDTNGKWERCAT